jgi:hypothetical protein
MVTVDSNRPAFISTKRVFDHMIDNNNIFYSLSLQQLVGDSSHILRNKYLFKFLKSSVWRDRDILKHLNNLGIQWIFDKQISPDIKYVELNL